MDLIFNDFLFMDDILEERRIYRMPIRATINTWDDTDFFRRFRLTKQTFLAVLQLVAEDLQHPQPR